MVKICVQTPDWLMILAGFFVGRVNLLCVYNQENIFALISVRFLLTGRSGYKELEICHMILYLITGHTD